MVIDGFAPRSDPVAVARDARWLAHRYDPGHDAVHFVPVSRAEHDRATFLTDDHLPAGRAPLVLRRDEALAAAGQPAPVHFIFHSAYCLSTLLARACDRPGVAMGLKEPVILNDLVGWRRRGAKGAEVARALDGALTLLARPFGPGEAVVVKPSNIVASLMPVMLAMRPQARALLLHAPLPVYLASIAKKGMEGRLWVRTLLVGLAQEGLVAPLGFDGAALLGLTDLQVGAVGWLVQHKLFAEIAAQHFARVRTLDSEVLTANPVEAMTALAQLFDLPLDDAAVTEIVAGPAFTRHSKSGAAFAGADRAGEHRDATALHAEEIEKVLVWAAAVAANAGVAMTLPAPLVGEGTSGT